MRYTTPKYLNFLSEKALAAVARALEPGRDEWRERDAMLACEKLWSVALRLTAADRAKLLSAM